MNNTAKTWWEVRTAMDANPAIVYLFRLEAESEAAARQAAADRIPPGNTLVSITPADGDFPIADLTGAMLI